MRNNSLRKLIVLLVLLSLVLSSLPLYSSSVKTIRVAYPELKNVMEGTSDGSVKSGYTYDYLRELAVYGGWKYEYVYGTFEELTDLFREGEIDIFPNFSKTSEREEYASFPSEPIIEEFYVIVAYKADFYDGSLSSLNGRRIGIVPGMVQNELLSSWAENNDVKLETSEFTDYSEMNTALKNGDVDIGLEISTSVPADISVLQPIGSEYSYIAVSKKGNTDVEEMDTTQNKLKLVEPFFKTSLYGKYFTSSLASPILSDSEKNWLKEHDSKIRICALADDAPYSYKDEDGYDAGIYCDLLSLMMDRLGIAPDIIEWSYCDSRREQSEKLKSGEIDVAVPVLRNRNASENNGLFETNTIFTIDMALVTKRNSLETAALKKIAVNGNKPDEYYIEDIFPDSEIVKMDGAGECFEALINGDVTSFIAESTIINNLLINSNSDCSITLLPQKGEVCFVATEDNYEVVRLFNRGLSLITSTEINDVIIRNSSSADSKNINLKEYLEQDTGFLLLIIAIFLLAIAAIILLLKSVISGRKLKEANEKLEDSNDRLEDMILDEKKKKEDLEKKIVERTNEIRERDKSAVRESESTIELFGDVVEMRNSEGDEHTKRIKAYTGIIASHVLNELPEYNLTQSDVELITAASALHDVGKIFISDTILLKPGKLTKEEFDVVKTHSMGGFNILSKTTRGWSERYLKTSYDICRWHHEKWDGNGYPDGLKGDEIPISAQIVSVADCFDALTSKRPYKRAYSPKEAYNIIKSGGCGAFSDRLMMCFDNSFEELSSYALDPSNAYVPTSLGGNDSLRGIKVLLVDDNELSLELNRNLLEAQGVVVTVAGSGREAVDIFGRKNEVKFDALLIDMVMPGLSGEETANAIREMDGGNLDSVPIILLSSEATDNEGALTFNSNINAYMSKPIIVSEFTSILLAYMREISENMEKKLVDTIKVASTDPLTGVKNASAYTDVIASLDEDISSGTCEPFAVVMADVNNLKNVNDTYGHDIGDIYIKNCCRILRHSFGRDNVYRIGGDEFAVILRGQDYSERAKLFSSAEERVEKKGSIPTIEEGMASVAMGLALYVKGEDTSARDVVKKADSRMYKNKNAMKDIK